MWKKIIVALLVCIGVVYSQSALERVQLTETDVVAESISPQQRIDTLKRALLHLPQPELERLGIPDLAERSIEAGSEQAQHLLNIWHARQEELRALAASMVKPAEHMQSIMATIASHHDDTSLIVERLTELESALTDIDNARDFHSLHLWTPLISYLSLEWDPSVRAAAAWCIGSAIKNTYDHQLWTINPITSSAPLTAFDLLLMNAMGAAQRSNEEEFDLLLRRCLYALSAAMRGNLDVQAYALSHNASSHQLMELLTQLRDTSPSKQVQRKIWAIVSDLLAERDVIRTEYSHITEISSAQLLGDVIASDTNWLNRAISTIRDYTLSCVVDGEIVHDCEYFEQSAKAESMLEVMSYLAREQDEAVKDQIDSIRHLIRRLQQ